jgi:tetratricopeptide (TPR) repeat protein
LNHAEKILDNLDSNQRPTLYAQVASGIESFQSDDTYYATLAHLWAVARNYEKELHYSQLTGAQAVEANAPHEALPYLQRALELVTQLPDSDEKSQKELKIRIPLTIALTHTQGFTAPQVEQGWERSLTLCNALDNPPETVGVLWGLCGMYLVSGKNDIAANMDDELLELAPSTPYPNLTKLQAFYTRTINLVAIGEIEQALDSTRACLSIYDPSEASQAIAMYGSNPGITAKVWEASLLVILGYPDQGQTIFNAALDEARAFDHPFTLSNILTFCWVWQVLGNWENAYELASENAIIADKYGYGFNMLMGMPLLGWGMAQRGEINEGIQVIKQALDMMHGMGASILRNYFLGMLADASVKLGQLDEAVEVIDEALVRIETSVDRFYEPEIYRIKGELLWTMDDAQDEAEVFVQRAIDTSKERNVRWFELRSTVCLAKLWQSQGKNQEAYNLLKPLYDWFTEGFDTQDMKIAKELLDELDA